MTNTNNNVKETSRLLPNKTKGEPEPSPDARLLPQQAIPNKRLKEETDPRVHNVHELIPLKQELGELTSMALQLSLRQMVRQAMTITDSAFQGHIGTKQLAGVSLAAMWMGVPSTFIQFSIQAISTLCSQAYGAGNNKLVGIWLQTAVVFSVLGAIPVMVYYCCVGYFISITMDDAETVEYGSQFAMVMALGLIPQYIYGACSTYFAAQGIIMPATICSALTMVLNVAFNRLYIYGALGWEGFGFIGSPLATVTSTCLQLILFLTYTVWWKRYHAKYWGGWSRECLDTDRVNVFLSLAIPMGASSVVDWASAAIAGAFSGFLGPNIAASQSVLGGVFGVANSAVSGFSTSTQIRMSRYLGKGSAEAAERVLFIGATIVLTGAIVMLGLVLTLRESIFRVWTSDPAILAMCSSALLVFVVCILVAFVRFLLTAVLNALALANINLWANNFASWCIYVPLSYLLPITWQWGLDGFWWADTFGEMFKVLILVFGVSRVDWHVAAARAQDAAEADDLEDGDNDDGNAQEQQQLVAYENEALVGRTPEAFRTPTAMTPSTPFHTPSARRRVRSIATPKAVTTGTRAQTPTARMRV
ncbi:hypothetical protein FI667_g4467, partial [Globisporangium splendens]